MKITDSFMGVNYRSLSFPDMEKVSGSCERLFISKNVLVFFNLEEYDSHFGNKNMKDIFIKIVS
jgi:hypothetical protein